MNIVELERQLSMTNDIIERANLKQKIAEIRNGKKFKTRNTEIECFGCGS